MKTKFDIDDLYPTLEKIETTIGSNGYPSRLQYAYYCDSKKEMEEIIEKLKSDGEIVEELFIHKKNGWSLWNRQITQHDLIDFTIRKESEWYIQLDMNQTEEDIKEEIKFELIGDDEDYIEEVGVEKVNEIVEDFYSNLEHYKDKGEVHIFYSPERENNIEYIITDDCTGYHDGDVTTYQMAFTVYEKDEEDEEW
jgi:hypothetical protein